MACGLFLFFINGLYREWYKESRFDEIVRSHGPLRSAFLSYSSYQFPTDHQFCEYRHLESPLYPHKTSDSLYLWRMHAVFLNTPRFAIHSLLSILFSYGIGVSKVLIIGANESGELLVKEIHAYARLGYRVSGFIDDDGQKKGSTFAGYKVIGTYSDLPAIVKKERIPALIIAHVSGSANEIMKILNYCGDIKVTIYMVPSLMDVITGHLKTHQIFGIPLLVLLQDHMPAWEADIKRLIDIAISAAVLIVGAPFWLIVAGAIRINSPGPLIYKQIRVGRNGKQFIMYK